MTKRKPAAQLLLFLTLGVLVALPERATGGAWTHKKGGYYLKLSGGYLSSTEDIDAQGTRVKKAGEGELTDASFTGYLEYGVTDALTLVVSAPYKRMTDNRTFATGITREKRNGFGDLDLRIRRRVLNGPTVVALAFGGKIPLWYDDTDPATRVPLSTRKVDLDARVLLGRSLYPAPAYLSGELGFRTRGGALSNEGFYSFEAGVSAGRFLFKGYVSGIVTTGECVSENEVSLIGDQNLLKVSPGIIYEVTPGVELSFDFFRVMSGCNTGAGNTFFFGVAYKK